MRWKSDGSEQSPESGECKGRNVLTVVYMPGCWDVNGEGGESERAMFWGLGHIGTALGGESTDWETLHREEKKPQH